MQVVGVLSKSSIASRLRTIPRNSSGHPACVSSADIEIIAAPGRPGVDIVRTIIENAREIIADTDSSTPYIFAAERVSVVNITGKAALHIDVQRGIERE